MIDLRKSIAHVKVRRRFCASKLSLQLLFCATMATPSCGGDSPESSTANTSSAAGRADLPETRGGARASSNSESVGSSGAAGVDRGGASVESSSLTNAAGYGGTSTQTGGIANAAVAGEIPSQLGGFANSLGPGGASSLSGGTVNSTDGTGDSAQTGGAANATTTGASGSAQTGGAANATTTGASGSAQTGGVGNATTTDAGGSAQTGGVGNSTSHAGSSALPGGSGGVGNSGGVGGSSGSSGVGSFAGGAGVPPFVLPLEGKPCVGYTLLGMPETSNGAKFPARLINMDGDVVHTWAIGGFPPKMLPGGSLIGCVGVIGTYDCAEMQQVTWDGVQEWSFSNWVLPGGIPASRQHHDLQREGNPVGFYAPGQNALVQGKTLVLAHIGRHVPAIRDQNILDDVIYEVDSTGALMNDFQWYGADHIDEFGFDAAARTQLRTTAPSNGLLEWLHGNSISLLGPNHWFDEGRPEFHPDNILYSSRDASFVIIISRETGNVVWRIGPDFSGRPEDRLGQFAGQHHPHLIPIGLPGAGNVLVFDNGGASGYGSTPLTGAPSRYSRTYSRVLEFNPVTFEVVWQYGNGAGEHNFFSQLISSAQRLPNGNTLITIGQAGRVIEVTPDKQIVWQYQQPTAPGGTTASLYRAFRIPPEWLPIGENALLGQYATWESLFESETARTPIPSE